MKSLLLSVIIIAISLNTNAQRKIKVNEISVSYTGFQESYSNINTLGAFKKLAPQTNLLSADSLLGHTTYYTRKGLASNGIGFNVGLSTINKNGKMSKLKWSLGANFFDRVNDYGVAFKSNDYRFDTLTSSQTGQQYFIDSTVSSRVGQTFNASELRFNLGMRYHTNLRTRLNLYCGIDGGYGTISNSNVELDKSNSSYIKDGFYSSFNGYGSLIT